MHRSSAKLLVVTIASLLLGCTALAEVSLSSLFSDGMVLQRNLPIHVWGNASPAEAVSVTFRGETRSIIADALGHWDVYLPPATAGGPYELTVRPTSAATANVVGTNPPAVAGSNLAGSNAAASKVIHDVLVGDVWIASGQSNMEFEMRKVDNAEAEIAAANFPKIRLLRVRKAGSEYPLDDAGIDAAWAKCDPTSVREFSAAAYYFGRELHQKLNVPIGIIESSWGGTLAEAWTSSRALTADAALMPVFAARSRMMEPYADLKMIQADERHQQEQARAEGRPVPQFPWHPLPEMWHPSALYNAMIAPLTKYPIRGVIWYQGESNSQLDRAFLYQRVFETMIRDWRAHWSIGEFPFLFTQISNFKSGPSEDWPAIREAQRKALGLRNTAMAVTIDIGNPNDVHPTNKRDVGHRLAVAARATVYSENVEFSGPLFRQATREEHALRVWFDHAEGLQAKPAAAPALTAQAASPQAATPQASAATLTGFEIAGADGKFVPAEARIDGSTVVVSNAAIANPVAVRYGWANSPECNLQNRVGLPASPFKSE